MVISATPSSGWVFNSWSGDVLTKDTVTTIKMDSPKSVTANFSVAAYSLTVTVNGSGTTVPAAGTRNYDAGTIVKITANPASGWQFDGWSGSASDNMTTTDILMNSNKNVVANFQKTAGNVSSISPTQQTQQFNVDSSAINTLNSFVKCALQADMNGMWALINEASKGQYRDSYDFKWSNGVYSDDQGGSLLASYEIISAANLPMWNGFPNVIECQLQLHFTKNKALSFLEPFSGLTFASEQHDTMWTTHLIKNANSWQVVCDSTNPFKSLWMK